MVGWFRHAPLADRDPRFGRPEHVQAADLRELIHHAAGFVAEACFFAHSRQCFPEHVRQEAGQDVRQHTLTMLFKLAESASHHWRTLTAALHLLEVAKGTEFQCGIILPKVAA